MNTLLVVYILGYSLCWVLTTIKDGLTNNWSAYAFAGRVIVCALWPVLLPQVAGLSVVVVINTLQKGNQ